MPTACRTGAYIKIADSGFDAELRVVLADREVQGKVDANIIEAFAKVFTAAAADMKKLRSRELTPPIKPHQFFMEAEVRND